MGPRKGMAVMVKNASKYGSTGGWGFQFSPAEMPRSRS
jgi:hypothetical protein